MSDVRLTVGGRHYTVACADGEEDHLRDLGGMVDAKLTAIGGGLGAPEAKNLLIAALILADEVHEAGKRAGAGDTGGAEGDPGEDFVSDTVVPALEMVADRLELCAMKLESGGSAS